MRIFVKKQLVFILLLFTFGVCLGHTEVKYDAIQKVQSKYPLGSEQNPIKIGLMMVDPFITKHDGVYQGLIMDYWRHISQDKDWYYVFIESSPNYTQVVEDTATGKYDLALGNFSTTADRMSSIYFSRPFMLNKISILTTVERINPLTILISVLYTMSEILLTIFVLIGFVSLFLWVFRPRGDETRLKVYFLIACVNLLGTVAGNRFKKTMLVILLLFSLIIKAIFIGSVTSTLFNLSLGSKDPFTNAEDIAGKLFVVVKGSSFSEKMRGLNARVYEYDGSNEQAADFYVRNSDQFDGYVSDFTLVYKYANQFLHIEPGLVVSDYNIRNDNLAFIFNKSFPFKTTFDQKILELQDTNLAFSICNVYVGDEASNCLM